MTEKTGGMDPRQVVDVALRAAQEKKGMEITVMDMQGVTLLCDYFVIISGNSRPHVRAVAQGIEDALKDQLGIDEKKIQGREEGSWILMDYGTVVVHVFLENLRSYYDLEGLWDKASIQKAQDTVPASG